MESPTTSIRTEAQLTLATEWWNGLSDAWKTAFNEIAFRRTSTEDLGDEMLLTVFNAPNHRFAGPTAPYPNMSFELSDLSGLIGLPSTEVVVVIFHQLTNLREVAQLNNLKSLFVHNNQITSLEGIETVLDLKEIYCNVNQITSLKPLENLVQLKTVYCNYNLISELDGIGEQHTDILEDFYCMPNPNLKDSTAMRFEREIGIRCKKA